MFHACYGRDFYKWVKGDVSGNYGKTLLGCTQPTYEYWAEWIHDAIAGAGTDKQTLIEMIIMANEQDVKAITFEYFKMYKSQVFDDIAEDISKSADWAMLCRAWWNAYRYPRGTPQQDAEALMKAAKGAATDE